MAVDFGVFVPQGWRMDLTGIDDPVEQYEAMTNVARVAEETGAYDSIWLYDHFHTVPEPTINTVFECWAATAGLARDTSTIKIGQMVSCNGYRNPSLLAKVASTTDVMSNGRLLFGLGAGWYEHEWRAYGYEWVEVPQRMGAFREAVQIVHKMWTEDAPTFQGKHYSIDAPINEPKSGVPGRKVPLWIGGGGEKVTLKLVAQYGDACNVGAGDPDTIKAKLAILAQHCDTVGRDYADITKSTSLNLLPIDDTANLENATAMRGMAGAVGDIRKNFAIREPAIRERIDRALEAGAEYIITYVPGLAYDDALLPALAEIVATYV